MVQPTIQQKCGNKTVFNRSSLRCNLCLNEKLEVALFKGNNILNRRTELISHKQTHSLAT